MRALLVAPTKQRHVTIRCALPSSVTFLYLTIYIALLCPQTISEPGYFGQLLIAGAVSRNTTAPRGYRLGYGRNSVILQEVTVAKGLVVSGDFNAETDIFVACLKSLLPNELQEVSDLIATSGVKASVTAFCAVVLCASKRRNRKRKAEEAFEGGDVIEVIDD
jgi:hypothetical protein